MGTALSFISKSEMYGIVAVIPVIITASLTTVWSESVPSDPEPRVFTSLGVKWNTVILPLLEWVVGYSG